MARPTSAVEVCNLMLSQMSQSIQISSIEPPDDGNKASQLCAQWFDIARLEVLRSATWNFARKSAVVDADTTAPLFNWTTRYEMPPDFVRPAAIQFDGSDPIDDDDFEIEGRYILCNASGTMQLRYIYDHNNPADWTPDFLTMFVNSLGKYVGMGLSGQEGAAKVAEERFERQKAAAKVVNGQEKRPKRKENSRFLARRLRMNGTIPVKG